MRQMIAIKRPIYYSSFISLTYQLRKIIAIKDQNTNPNSSSYDQPSEKDHFNQKTKILFQFFSLIIQMIQIIAIKRPKK
jgi:hypothetical protein